MSEQVAEQTESPSGGDIRNLDQAADMGRNQSNQNGTAAMPDSSQDEDQQPGRGKPRTIAAQTSAVPDKDIPKDFSSRAATKITAINERELDEEIASSKVAAMIFKNMNAPGLYDYFVDTIDHLLQTEHTEKYAATTWTALLWHEDVHPEYREFVEQTLHAVIDGHVTNKKPTHEHEESGKEFSSYAYSLGETFIQMMRLNSDLYNILTDIYSFIIREEMNRDLTKADEDTKKKLITGRKKQKGSEYLNPW